MKDFQRYTLISKPTLLLNQRETVSASANLCDAGSRECYDDSHHINSKLKLEELGDAVVDITSPHDGFDDAGKIIVGQDDVRRLFGYVCAGDALETKTTRMGILFSDGSELLTKI